MNEGFSQAPFGRHEQNPQKKEEKQLQEFNRLHSLERRSKKPFVKFLSSIYKIVAPQKSKKISRVKFQKSIANQFVIASSPQKMTTTEAEMSCSRLIFFTLRERSCEC